MDICPLAIGTWNLLNENIVSSLIGATAFAFLGAGLLNRHETRKAKGETIQKMKHIIGTQITDNLLMVDRVLNDIGQGGVHNLPKPFRTSALQTFIQTGLIDRVSPDLAYAIIDLDDRLQLVNDSYSSLIDFSIGIQAATSQSATIRTHMCEFLKKVLPILKEDLGRLKESLEKAK